MRSHAKRQGAFSLVEVVLALGIVAFAVLAIVGLIPVGLNTARLGQGDTRADQIAADILTSIATQAQSRFPNVTISQPSTGFSYNVDLSNITTHKWMAADDDGTLVTVDPSNPADELKHPYQIKLFVTPDPPGFDSSIACLVTVRVITPPSPDPDAPLTSNQTTRDYSRIVTKL